MADIRDIMRDRLANFDKYIGQLNAAGESTEPLRVRNFQSGTIYVDVQGSSGDLILVVEGTDNKGENKWFNLDENDKDFAIAADGNHAFTYVAEVQWIRIRWKSGTATRVKVSAHISKNITGNK